jgi:hypothetical protein
VKHYAFVALASLGAIAVLVPLSAERSITVRPATILQIGIVQNPGEYDGAGCRFQLRSDYAQSNDRYIFATNAEEQGIFNINGADVWLHRAGFDAGTGNSLSRFVDRYGNDELEARVDLVVTKKCDPSDENCEATLYDAVITLKRGSAQRTIRARGFCGM